MTHGIAIGLLGGALAAFALYHVWDVLNARLLAALGPLVN